MGDNTTIEKLGIILLNRIAKELQKEHITADELKQLATCWAILFDKANLADIMKCIPDTGAVCDTSSTATING